LIHLIVGVGSRRTKDTHGWRTIGKGLESFDEFRDDVKHSPRVLHCDFIDPKPFIRHGLSFSDNLIMTAFYIRKRGVSREMHATLSEDGDS
jgi:hypothetical protein